MLDTVDRLREDAAKCADAALWALSDNELATAVEQVHRLEQTIAAVQLHLIAELDGRDLPTRQNVRGTATWLRSRLLLDGTTARRLVEQAAALGRHPAVDAALGAGAIHLRQAAAITDALDALPSTALAADPLDDDGRWPAGATPVPRPAAATLTLRPRRRWPRRRRRRCWSSPPSSRPGRCAGSAPGSWTTSPRRSPSGWTHRRWTGRSGGPGRPAV
jgi:hypothetical protein